MLMRIIDKVTFTTFSIGVSDADINKNVAF